MPSFRFFVPGEHANVRSLVPGFRSGGTSECTLVPVFVPGEHLPKPPLWKKKTFWQPLNVIQNNSQVVADVWEKDVCREQENRALVIVQEVSEYGFVYGSKL